MGEFAKWFIVGMFALGALITIASVGKPRRPLQAGTAAWVVFWNGLYVVLIVVFWRN